MINFVKIHKEKNELYINTNIVNAIIERFQKEIISNKDILIEMYNIDIAKCNQTTDINKIIELLNTYKNEEVSANKKKKIVLASYYGTPYITVNLCIQALLQKKAFLLAIEDSMLAVNKLLVTIFNTILEEYKIVKLVKICNMPRTEEIKEISETVDNVVCIGNSDTYYQYKKMKMNNLKFVPFKNMAIYSDNMEYEQIQHELYKYAVTNGIEVEVYDDMELNEFIECIEIEDTVENIVIFIQDKEIGKIVEDKIKDKKIFVNKNPFKNEKFRINI